VAKEEKRRFKKLSASEVKSMTKPGLHGDGDGLYLQVRGPEVKSWIFRWERDGKQRSMGLGSAFTVTLADAREKAQDCRKLLLDEKDPIAVRDAKRAQAKVEALKSKTFEQCAEIYIEAHRAGWRNEKHAAQWLSTLKTYAYPVFGNLPVHLIDTCLVMKVLEPIWTKRPETASRLRGRIEAVLNWAKTREYRAGENPAAWKGHLENLLPARRKVATVEHHPALPYDDLGAFMAALRAQEGTAAKALEYLILTAARTGEVIGARWDEIDLDHKDGPLWLIPAPRTKAKKEHRVPLAPAAVAVIQALRARAEGDFIFPSVKSGQPLSNMGMLVLLERMGHHDITVHGFRSTFRDWVGESTSFPVDVAEAALAHTRKDKTEAAYARGDLFRKRRKLMEAWAAYCTAPAKGGKVVQLKRASKGL
jgi:integrase